MCNERVAAAWCVCVHDERVYSRAAGEAALKGRTGCALGPAEFKTSAQAAGINHGVVMRRDAFTGLLTGSTDGLLRMVEMVTHTHTQTGFNGF